MWGSKPDEQMLFKNTDCWVPIHAQAHCPYLYTKIDPQPRASAYHPDAYLGHPFISPGVRLYSRKLYSRKLYYMEVNSRPYPASLLRSCIALSHSVPNAKPETPPCKRTSRHSQRPVAPPLPAGPDRVACAVAVGVVEEGLSSPCDEP